VNLVAASFLAILPIEDGHPAKDAGQQPPGRVQDQKKEKDPGKKSQQTSFDHANILD
jgi:hypothetical protein